MKIKTFFSNILIISIIIFIISYAISKYTQHKILTSIPRYSQQQQIEFTKTIDNLYPNGSVTSEGWARHPIWNYKRNFIKFSKIFIKEWDYYISYIEKNNIWIAVTISDL